MAVIGRDSIADFYKSAFGEVLWSSPRVGNVVHVVGNVVNGQVVIVVGTCNCPNAAWPTAIFVVTSQGQHGWLDAAALKKCDTG